MKTSDIKDMMVKVAESDMDIHVKADVMLALKKMYDEENVEKTARQEIEEGDVVEISEQIFVVAQIFDLKDYLKRDNEDLFMAVLYSPIKKRLGFAFESLYTDPDMCKIISHIDPGMIFREDVKCV